MEDNELEQKLQQIKDMIDDAYDVTKNKYTEADANHAIFNYFLNYKANGITRDNNARQNLKDFLYRPNEFYQILLDYAISSYISNNMNCDITYEELIKYLNDKDGSLDYSGTKPIKLVALATGINTYWAVNIISVNQKLKTELIINLITERYIQNKRQQLDVGKKVKIVKLPGYSKDVMISKNKLNNDVRNMNNDDEYEEYIVPSRKSK